MNAERGFLSALLAAARALPERLARLAGFPPRRYCVTWPEGLDRARAGRRAEEVAASWLRKRGCRMVSRNFRCRGGELDLVVDDDGALVFVEVKYRKNREFGRAEEAVDSRKRARILRAAKLYLAKLGPRQPKCRFDVVAVEAGGRGMVEIRRIRDAFRPGWD